MKLSGFVMMLLLVGFIFSAVSFIVVDFETAYPEMTRVERGIGVNDTLRWDEDFNFANDISTYISNISEDWQLLTSQDSSFFEKGVGFIAIPIAVMALPIVVIAALGNQVLIITRISDLLALPEGLATWATVALSIVLIFKLIGWWRRDKTA